VFNGPVDLLAKAISPEAELGSLETAQDPAEHARTSKSLEGNVTV
jgi:hypothetical protein